MLKELGAGVHESGPATVHGVRTTKYTGSLDLSKASTGSGQHFATQAKQLGLEQIPFAFYVDGNGLPARMTMTMTGLGGSGGAAKATSSTVIDWTDWGLPVHVTAPAGAVSRA